MSVLSYIPGTKAWRERRDLALCAKTGERVQEIVDGELEPKAAAQELVRHLEACQRCSREAEAVQEIKRAIARVGGSADEEMVSRLQVLAEGLCRGTIDADIDED